MPVSEVGPTHQMIWTVMMAFHSGATFPGGAFILIESLLYLPHDTILSAVPGAKPLQDFECFSGDFPEEGE